MCVYGEKRRRRRRIKRSRNKRSNEAHLSRILPPLRDITFSLLYSSTSPTVPPTGTTMGIWNECNEGKLARTAAWNSWKVRKRKERIEKRERIKLIETIVISLERCFLVNNNNIPSTIFLISFMNLWISQVCKGDIESGKRGQDITKKKKEENKFVSNSQLANNFHSHAAQWFE